MAVSQVSQFTKEGYAFASRSFSDSGTPFIAWTTEGGGAMRRLWWRRHDGADATEVGAALSLPFRMFDIVPRGSGAQVLVVYADVDTQDAKLYAVIFDRTTGALVAGPNLIAPGGRPSVTRMLGSTTRVFLTYREPKAGAIYIRESYDDGITWSSARPILNNKVAATDEVVAVAFDETHVSIGQVGRGARNFSEVGSFTRTRPLGAALYVSKGRALVMEPTFRTGQNSDTLRGRMVLDGAGNVLATSRARQGTSDGVGDLMLVDGTIEVPTIIRSATLASGAKPGGEIVRAPADASAPGSVVYTVPGSEYLLDLVVYGGYCFFAASAETPASGLAGWLKLADLANGTFALGANVTRVGAITVSNAAGSPLVLAAVGGIQNGAHFLKLATFADPPSGMSFATSHVMPAKVNHIAIVITGATTASIFVAMADRVNVYAYSGLANPIRLLRSYTLLTLGEVMQMIVTTADTVVCALSRGGVAAFGSQGETLAQTICSGVVCDVWKPSTAYAQGVAFVRPTELSPYAPQRRYFTCSRSGTSGTVEPAWGPTGTINDPTAGGAGWTEGGSREAFVSSVAIDVDYGRVYATAVLGGTAGTTGRLYCLDSSGLLKEPVRVPTPIFSVREGSLTNAPVYLTISTSVPTAEIHYTTDGSTPTLASPIFDPASPIPYIVSGKFLVRARAFADGFRPSNPTELHFTIDLPDVTPILANPGEGVYMTAQSVVLSCPDTIGVTIRYTTDGTDPTPASPIFNPLVPIQVIDTTVVKARGYKVFMDPSPIYTGVFIVVAGVIPTDAASVSHVRATPGAIYDIAPTGGVPWTMQGTVPVDPVATVFAGRPRMYGLGPFSDTNYYRSTSLSDALDLGGDFTATIVFKSALANGGAMFGNGNTSAGFFFEHWTAPTYADASYNNSGMISAGGASILDGANHVMTLTRRGNMLYVKLDGRAIVSRAWSNPGVPATGMYAYIGRYDSVGYSFPGRVYELRVTNVGLDPTALDALHATIMGV